MKFDRTWNVIVYELSDIHCKTAESSVRKNEAVFPGGSPPAKTSAEGSHVGTHLALPPGPPLFSQSIFFPQGGTSSPKSFLKKAFLILHYENWGSWWGHFPWTHNSQMAEIVLKVMSSAPKTSAFLTAQQEEVFLWPAWLSSLTWAGPPLQGGEAGLVFLPWSVPTTGTSCRTGSFTCLSHTSGPVNFGWKTADVCSL